MSHCSLVKLRTHVFQYLRAAVLCDQPGMGVSGVSGVGGVRGRFSFVPQRMQNLRSRSGTFDRLLLQGRSQLRAAETTEPTQYAGKKLYCVTFSFISNTCELPSRCPVGDGLDLNTAIIPSEVRYTHRHPDSKEERRKRSMRRMQSV